MQLDGRNERVLDKCRHSADRVFDILLTGRKRQMAGWRRIRSPAPLVVNRGRHVGVGHGWSMGDESRNSLAKPLNGLPTVSEQSRNGLGTVSESGFDQGFRLRHSIAGFRWRGGFEKWLQRLTAVISETVERLSSQDRGYHMANTKISDTRRAAASSTQGNDWSVRTLPPVWPSAPTSQRLSREAR